MTRLHTLKQGGPSSQNEPREDPKLRSGNDAKVIFIGSGRLLACKDEAKLPLYDEGTPTPWMFLIVTVLSSRGACNGTGQGVIDGSF